MARLTDPSRDLLFGLLALQTGLIDQGQLMAAFHAWTRDKARPLADHLLALSHLDPAHRPPLEGLAAAHLARHGGDAAQRLAAESRYVLGRLHARGGLGEILLARDEELQREVALKRMQPHQGRNEDGRRRFLAEAEVTGRLEHPGIVPVYGLGTYGDGRPYYAMRFIRGDSLKEAIERFHADEESKHDPGLSGSGANRPSVRDVTLLA